MNCVSRFSAILLMPLLTVLSKRVVYGHNSIPPQSPKARKLNSPPATNGKLADNVDSKISDTIGRAAAMTNAVN